MIRLRVWGLAAAIILTLACGYRVGGKADLVPKTVQTIAIPTFVTSSTRYKLIDALPQEIGREFRERTRFRVENNPGIADAVLNGSVNSVQAYPALSDPTTGKATSVRVVVLLTVRLVERTTGKVLYSRVQWAIHEDYAAAIDPHQFFDESGPAFDRLTRDIARDLVSAVVENF